MPRRRKRFPVVYPGPLPHPSDAPPARGPLWQLEMPARPIDPPLDGDLEVEVAVIGAGITGLTAAYLLARRGVRVVLIDRYQVGAGVTSATTGHLTAGLDVRYAKLMQRFGRDQARVAVRLSLEAIDFIERLIEELDAGAEIMRRVDGWLYSEEPDGASSLDGEAKAAAALGLTVEKHPAAPVPWSTAGALRLPGQGQLQPLRYVEALAAGLRAAGGLIIGGTPVQEVIDGAPCRVRCGRHTVRADRVIEATHTPVGVVLALQARLLPRTSHVVAVELQDDSPAPADALYWDDATPYHYWRVQHGVWVVGGADHDTGHTGVALAAQHRLERYVRQRVQVERVVTRWSSEVFEPADGLPFVGRLPGRKCVYGATGFSGTGLTFGTASARILAEAVVGGSSEGERVLSPSRLKLSQLLPTLRAGWHFVRGLIDARTEPRPSFPGVDIARGSGRLMRLEGGRLAAVARDRQGRLHILKPTCTHALCTVRWNALDETWDCPCHGGRYLPDGTVLSGPPTEPLVPLHLPKK